MAVALVSESLLEKLSTKLIKRFAKIKALKKKLESKEKLFSSAIKKLIVKDKQTVITTGTNEEGEVVTTYIYAPVDSPYLLEYQKFPKLQVSYKEELLRMFKLHYGKVWSKEWDARMEEIGKEEVDRLNEPKVNPEYVG